VVVAEGDSPSVLRGAPGHRPGTPLPGARGNSVVYGHQKDWGGPFAAMSRLKVGDQLYLQARPGVFSLQAGQTGDFIYTVTSVRVTPDGDLQPLAKSSDYRLTLITNAGSRLSSSHVLVVTAVSGTPGRSSPPPKHGSLQPVVGPVVFNGTVGSLRVRALATVGVVALLRRRHRPGVVAAISVPLVLATLLPLFLALDVAAFRPLA
jgi:sortase A